MTKEKAKTLLTLFTDVENPTDWQVDLCMQFHELAKRDEITNGELLTKEEHLKRCLEHYEQGRFDAIADLTYGVKR